MYPGLLHAGISLPIDSTPDNVAPWNRSSRRTTTTSTRSNLQIGLMENWRRNRKKGGNKESTDAGHVWILDDFQIEINHLGSTIQTSGV